MVLFFFLLRFVKDDINFFQDVNECLTSPCSNGGTCRNLPGSFVCQCAPGWTGQTCQLGTSLLEDICFSLFLIWFFYKHIK